MHRHVPRHLGHPAQLLPFCPPSRVASTITTTTLTTPHNVTAQLPLYHPFSTTIHHHKQPPLPPRPKLPETDLKKVFVKGSGPGGQKINKTNSAVQLTHLPTGIVVKSQATRSRLQNGEIAKRLLAEKIEVLEKGPESRKSVKEERVRRKKMSAGKKARRKYRKLEDGKDGVVEDDGGGVDGEGGEEGIGNAKVGDQ